MQWVTMYCMAFLDPSRAACSHWSPETSVFELTPRNLAMASNEFQDMRSLFLAKNTGSISFLDGNGSRSHFARRVRRNGKSNLAPLWAIQMSYWDNSSTMALTTPLSSLRCVFHRLLSLSARKILGLPLAGLTTPHKTTPKSAERFVVSRSKQQHEIWLWVIWLAVREVFLVDLCSVHNCFLFYLWFWLWLDCDCGRFEFWLRAWLKGKASRFSYDVELTFFVCGRLGLRRSRWRFGVATTILRFNGSGVIWLWLNSGVKVRVFRIGCSLVRYLVDWLCFSSRRPVARFVFAGCGAKAVNDVANPEPPNFDTGI